MTVPTCPVAPTIPTLTVTPSLWRLRGLDVSIMRPIPAVVSNRLPAEWDGTPADRAVRSPRLPPRGPGRSGSGTGAERKNPRIRGDGTDFRRAAAPRNAPSAADRHLRGFGPGVTYDPCRGFRDMDRTFPTPPAS
ncbi:hypothetical protein Stsp02_12640 [Streptomyces sp. NBRC 14336]|nr:hypothetical protein Stsp02_12640 [Streptomyces sp. NBRC 14336]